jgi:hypothetical protein
MIGRYADAMRVLLLFWSCTWALSLGFVPAAWAQSDPELDPNSPAGEEYKLPVDRARQDARPHSPGGATAAPLFGAGVGDTPRDSSSGSSQDQSTASSSGSAKTSNASPAPGSSTHEPVRAQAPAPGAGGGGTVPVAASAAGVLLIGGLAGLAWRRRSQQRGQP